MLSCIFNKSGNSVDLDQMALSETSSYGSTGYFFQRRINPGSAGQGLIKNFLFNFELSPML